LYLDGHVEWVRQGTKYPYPNTKGDSADQEIANAVLMGNNMIPCVY